MKKVQFSVFFSESLLDIIFIPFLNIYCYVVLNSDIITYCIIHNDCQMNIKNLFMCMGIFLTKRFVNNEKTSIILC